MSDRKRLCKRCLLEDAAAEEYIENMRINLQGLEESIKTDELTYRQRLLHCKDCDNLFEGICKICGCFVEYRAAINHKSCPDMEHKW